MLPATALPTLFVSIGNSIYGHPQKETTIVQEIVRLSQERLDSASQSTVGFYAPAPMAGFTCLQFLSVLPWTLQLFISPKHMTAVREGRKVLRWWDFYLQNGGLYRLQRRNNSTKAWKKRYLAGCKALGWLRKFSQDVRLQSSFSNQGSREYIDSVKFSF